MDKRTWGDVGGACEPVSVELWPSHGTVRLVAAVRHASGRLEGVGFLFLDGSPDAWEMARMAISGELPPAILADWIEDNPECWRCPCDVRNAAVAAICARLRAH